MLLLPVGTGRSWARLGTLTTVLEGKRLEQYASDLELCSHIYIL
jgi:hypothetical protein